MIVLSMLIAATSGQRALLNGIDASFVPEYRDLKTEFYRGTEKVDALKAFAEDGSNVLRLRVWVNPKAGYCSVAETLKMAKEAKQLKMHLLIDFHYSDWWADPQHQPVPAAWASLNLQDLAAQVKKHTQDTLDKLAAQGTPADSVQVGNEIRTGMCWPLGKRETYGFENLSVLLRAGVNGVRESKGGKRIKIVIHHDSGGNFKECQLFFNEIKKRGVKFDWIGLSYYPWWHGTLDQLKENMVGLSSQFKLPVWIVETAYPFTLGWQDSTGNFLGSESQLLPGYPASPEGQAAYLRQLNSIVRSVPDNRGVGVIYWAPEYVAQKGIETPCENLCLFDFEHRILPGSKALAK